MDRVLGLLYLNNPAATSFSRAEEIPPYISDTIPVFVVAIVLEIVLSKLIHRGHGTRLNDGLGSLGAGILQQLFGLVTKSLFAILYIWIYEKYHLLDLNSLSLTAWILAAVGVDFCYYWAHRGAHEVNLFWGMGHVVHHSSEDFNLTTALRQGAGQDLSTMAFWFPLAVLGVPPVAVFVHKQFNTISQFWFHTELIPKLGFLEYILNTPSAHRVHHGRNPYCIDKNYGGFLIIWDILFGTYAEERDEEPVVYGLVHPINSFSPIYIQFHHMMHIFSSFLSAKGLSNKLSVLFKGPGWQPGTPRLGNPEDIPAVPKNAPRYNPKLHPILNIYIFVHFVISLAIFLAFQLSLRRLAPPLSALMAFFVMLSLSVFGGLCDRTEWAAPLELLRILLFLTADILIREHAPLPWIPEAVHTAFYCVRIFFGVSLVALILYLAAFETRLQVAQTEAPPKETQPSESSTAAPSSTPAKAQSTTNRRKPTKAE